MIRQTTFQRTLLPLLVSALLLFSGCAQKQRETPADTFRLTVLHSNDTHANWGGFTDNGRICYAPLCENGSGGVLRASRVIRLVREQEPATLLLGAGDQFQGTLFFTRHKEAMAADVVNGLGYDAFVPGNHEFDDGCGRFGHFVRALKAPVLAANLRLGPGVEAPIAPWVVVERQGRRIGIIGLANPDTPNLSSPCAEAVFAPAEAALRKAVDDVRAQHANIIILVTHLGLEDDRRLAGSVSHVDIIVGGHSHSILSNTDPKAEGAYPVLERSPAGEPVLVVTNGYGLKTLGRLNVAFNAAGVATAWDGAPIPLNETELSNLNAPAADTALIRMMEDRSAPLRTMLRESVGEILSGVAKGSPLEKTSVLQCRAEECLTGNLVADAMRAYWKGRADIAIMNGGTVRGSLPSGSVTTGDILASLPFENNLMLAEMKGSVLLAALEQGVSRHEEKTGSFPQVSGMRYTFNPANARGRRIVSAQVLGRDGSWQPVRPNAVYGVATGSFLAGGGDGYSMFVGLSWMDSEQNLSDVVREYIRSHTPVHVQLEHRITRQ